MTKYVVCTGQGLFTSVLADDLVIDDAGGAGTPIVIFYREKKVVAVFNNYDYFAAAVNKTEPKSPGADE